ncbi:MAG: SLBB domain-containing protein, partial [Gammaproteobacteria bacterium]
GLSFDELKNLVANTINSSLIGTEVSITIKELRSINVYIVGQSYKPGAYTISAMSSVTNALFASGGVNESGSLRHIQIKRNGKKIHDYDFYQLILKGDTSSDIRLMNGDTIFIPFLENTVRLNGEFRRSGLYEFKNNETVGDLLALAGGIKNNFSAGTQLELSRVNRDIGVRELEVISLISKNELQKTLAHGDVLNLAQKSGLEEKVVELKGEFVRPGFYSLSDGETVFSVIERAGGYTKYAYDEGAIFTREQVAKQQKEGFLRNADLLEETLANAITNGNIENASEFTLTPITTLIKKLRDFEPIGRQVVDLDLLTLKTDPYKNFELRSGDTITMPKRPISVNVVGEVLNSSSHAFDADLSVYDYINLSGGISDQADEDKIVLVLPNGQSSLFKRKLFGVDSSTLIPGTTIVVSKDPRPPFEAIQITSIVTPILADLATAAAALNAISSN